MCWRRCSCEALNADCASSLSARLDEIGARAESVLGTQLIMLQAAVAVRRALVFNRLDKDSKSPDAYCRQMLAYLNRSANPQRLHPSLEHLAFRPSASAVSAPHGRPEAMPPPIGTALKWGSRYRVTVAQMSAVFAQEPPGNRSTTQTARPRDGARALEKYGVRPDESIWLNTLADVLCSTKSVK